MDHAIKRRSFLKLAGLGGAIYVSGLSGWASAAAKAGSAYQDFAFLASLRRSDGSYRYSRAYATTPVWVTAQVLPGLMKKPFPLR